MKKLFYVFFALTLGLAAASCAKEYDDTELKGKVNKLSEEVNTLKANQQAMQAIIDVWKAGGYIQSIDNSVPGQHTITFYGENGKVVVIYDGLDGEDGEDGEDGAPGAPGAPGADGDAFFKSVVTTEDGVTFTLNDEQCTSFTIPFAKAFKLVIETPEAEVEAGVDVEFPYTVNNANETTTVDVFAGGNYAAAVNATDKKIVVTPPTPATPGNVLAWAQNNEGLFSMVKLNFLLKAETTVTTSAEEYQAIPADAGTFDVAIVSNVEIEVPSPEVDWVSVNLTKAAYTLVLTLAENTTGEPREAVIKILRKDNGKQVQEIKIVQLGEAANPAIKKDVLNVDFTGIDKTNTSYQDWEKNGTKSNAVYVGQTGRGQSESNTSIQFRTKNSNSGIVTTVSGGLAQKVVIKFNSATTDRSINIYGKNTAYTAPTDLYNEATAGTLLGTIKAGTGNYTLDIAEPYGFIGFRSAADAIYVDEIDITWDSEGVIPEAPKVPALERVWGFYKDGDTPWYATTNITGVSIAHPDGYGMARGLAMDDEYIYLPKSSGYANVAAVSIADKTAQKALNKTGVSGGSVFATSFVRMIKNTDSSVNGGKDVLLLCNLTATASDEAQLKLYAYKDGIDAAPTKIAAFCWDSANNVNDWRRYGDRFFVTGNWAEGKVYFPSFDANKTVVLSIANGARTAVTQIAAGADNSPAGIKDLTVYPGDTKLFLTNPSIANLVAPTGGKANGWDEYSLSSSIENGKNTWGYNFFEFNGVKYIAYARIIGETKAQIEVIVDKGDLATSLAAQEGLMKSPIHDATDLDKEVATGNLADCCVRVIGENVYIAALTRDGGFVLDKMVLKDAE